METLLYMILIGLGVILMGAVVVMMVAIAIGIVLDVIRDRF